VIKLDEGKFFTPCPGQQVVMRLLTRDLFNLLVDFGLRSVLDHFVDRLI